MRKRNKAILLILSLLFGLLSPLNVSRAASDIKVIQTNAKINSISIRFEYDSPVDIKVNGQQVEKNYKKKKYTIKLKGMAPGMRYGVTITPTGETGGTEYTVKTSPQTSIIYAASYDPSNDLITTNWKSDSYICDGYQLKSYNKKGKVIKTLNITDSKNSSTIENIYKNNQFNKVRIRGYIQCEKKKVYSNWSSYRYIAHMTGCKFSAVSKKHNIKATWKKVTGASKYIVYVGEKSDGSDKKKVGTYKAKKTSCTIKKYGMADLEYDKYYYVFITPYTKVGKKQKASDVSVSSEPVMCFSWK